MLKSVKKAIGWGFLRATGWREEGDAPTAPKYVLIAAPHTSNWDFPYMMAMSFVFDVPLRWMGKHTLFKGPKGLVFRALGGIPVVRHERRNMVQAMADLFGEHETLVVVVPAEGSRSYREYWKSGFYRIAENAGVPVVCSYLDFRRRRGGFGPPVPITGNMKEDMDAIRAFYEGIEGKFPEKFGPIRLKEELSEEELAEIQAKRDAAQR